MANVMCPGRILIPVTLVLILAMCPSTVWSQSDYHDKDFSVRLASSFIWFTDVSTLGGETVANRYSSAINPATLGWYPLPDKLGLILSPYYSTVGFDEGARLHVTGESLTWDSRSWGAFQPTLSQIRSNNWIARDGLSFDYQVDSAQMQWGKRFGDLGLGACFNFARAEVGRAGTVMSGPVPVNVDSHGSAESYRWRFGSLYQPADKWLMGLVFEYGFQPYRSRTNTTPPIGPISTSYESGLQQQFILRPGVSYEVRANVHDLRGLSVWNILQQQEHAEQPSLRHGHRAPPAEVVVRASRADVQRPRQCGGQLRADCLPRHVVLVQRRLPVQHAARTAAGVWPVTDAPGYAGHPVLKAVPTENAVRLDVTGLAFVGHALAWSSSWYGRGFGRNMKPLPFLKDYREKCCLPNRRASAAGAAGRIRMFGTDRPSSMVRMTC